MKVAMDPAPLVDHGTEAFYMAAEDVLDYTRAMAPRVTGTYASTLGMWRRKRKTGPTATVGNRRVPYAGVIERGGGPHAGWKHRGPHVQRANAPHPLRNGAEMFAEFYYRRLGMTPIRGSAYLDVGHGVMRERMPPELSLVGD